MIEAFWSLSVDQALVATGGATTGLGKAEATARLRRDGTTAIGAVQHLPGLVLFARQFKSPLALILLFGAGISMLLRDWLDAAIILMIVGGSGLLSFTQEYRASQAVAALRSRLALKARVLRDGKLTEVPVREIVCGDIVELSAGNLVPADGLVLAAKDCLVTQSALTGESLPVEKSAGVLSVNAQIAERTNALFTGSSLRSGTATMLVIKTGTQTEFGAIARQVGTADEETEFTRGIRQFGTMLLRVMIVIVLAVLTINQLMGRPIIESLLFAVALAVGLSPEMLPAIISVTLAAGARHLAADGVIVRRLDAIENLGSMDVFCTDKTGTLTDGTVQLESAIDWNGAPSDQVMHAAFLNATFETGIANPLDEAIVADAHLAFQRLDAVDPQSRGFLVRFGFLLVVAGQLFLFAAGLVTIAVVRLVIEDVDVLVIEQIATGAPQHFTVAFGGADRLRVIALQQPLGDLAAWPRLAMLEGVVVGDDDLGALHLVQHFGRHKLAIFVIVVGRARHQHP